jgi:hypothetical protein
LCLLLLFVSPSAPGDEQVKAPIVVREPHYGEVLFHFYQENYFPAIVRLLVAKEQGRLAEHADEAELLLGGLYLSYGHHLEAADIFERMLADNVTPEVRDRTWFFLARIWYQRGYLVKAQQALRNISTRLPENLQREASMLDAQILIDAGKYDEAIERLSRWDGDTDWASYARFNIGVALVRSGRVGEARVLLDELGNMEAFSEETLALRDKANLALGYALLQDGQPLAAKEPLQRVRLEGPFSNKALLGVGWADAQMSSFRRALVPWMELRERDLLDSAVQESLLAIPYAMAKLDSISQAADHYLNAIEAFYAEAARLDRTIERIKSGEFFDRFLDADPLGSAGWYWQVQSLPDGPEARYLSHLLATHEFQEGLKNYRDLDYLRRNLDDWQQNIEVFENMLATREEAYGGRLPETEAALERADIDGMVARKLELDSSLNNIEESHDWLAMATPAEFDMWGEITGFEQAPALRADIPEAAETRDKIELIKGVLQWELEREFKERLWRTRRNLRDAGVALVETQRARRQIDETLRLEPQRFDELGARVRGLAPRIDALSVRVEQSMAAQREFLQAIAVKELKAQKERLEVYTVQARFALAAIYDIAARDEEGSQ